MAMKEKLVDAINEQIQAEFQSAYLYLSMASWFTETSMQGFAHWMRIQWHEETMHAMKLYDFVHGRGATVTLLQVDAPQRKFKNAVEVFELVRKHEVAITERINVLYELAVQEKDLPLQIVLQWFINEQVEEEAQVIEIIEHLKMVGSDGPSLFMLDRQMASRPSLTVKAME